MTNRLIMSVAATALIAGAGFAHAQGTGMGREGSPAGSSAQQSAPSSERGNSAAPSNRGGGETTSPSSGMKATQSDEKSPGAAKNQRAEDKDMQGQKSKSMSSETDRAKGGKDMKAEGREGSKDMKAEGREGRGGNMNAQGREDQKSNMNAQTREGQTREGQKSNMNAEQQKGTTDRPQMDRSQTGQSSQSTTTTGQAGAGAKLSTEQRTQITSVIREQRVQPLNNVNFSISVGTRVPRDVSFHTLPERVVTIYPEWRGYKFVLVKEQIVVVDPNTYEIVAVLEA